MSETLIRQRITTADVVRGNIAAERARAGVTQAELAGALGITQATISRRNRGEAMWPLDDLDVVAELLGVTVAELVTPTGRERCPRQDSNLQPSDYTFAALGCTWAVAA